MKVTDLPPALQKLSSLGDTWDLVEWNDYRSLGIDSEHTPLLIEIVRSATSYWEDLLWDETEPAFWLPVHAWRALGQLQAKEALPDLLALLDLIEKDENELVQEDLPDVLAAMGPEAIPSLIQYLDTHSEIWSRLAAAEALQKIALQNPETHALVTDSLIRALEHYQQEDSTFNGFIVWYLMKLKAIVAAPLVEQAFQAGRVDESINGDWEDYQIGVGLLEKRLNPPHYMVNNAFSDGLPVMTGGEHSPHNRAEEKKTKTRRKQSTKSRKKNQKKKKKK